MPVATYTVNLLSTCAALLGLIALLLLWRLRRQHAQLQAERALRLQAQQLLHGAQGRIRRLDGERRQIRAQERRSLGRDVHDDLGQHLLTLKMDVASLQASDDGAKPRLSRTLQLMASNIEHGIAALRCVVAGLRPPALEHGVLAAMRHLLADFTRASGIPAEHAFVLADEAQASLDRHETVLYRALQEALANIARHAQATRVDVRLHCHGAQLHLSIVDNGIGMADAAACKGCGLAGMEERLHEAGGALRIASSPGDGTSLQLSLPLAAQHGKAPARVD